jgi:hypothetical protein
LEPPFDAQRLFCTGGLQQALEALERCETALEEFAARVYAEEGEGASPYGAG